MEQLRGLAGDELTEILYLETSFLQKALAIIALLVSIFPGVGPVVAALALLANQKLPCWPRTVSYVAIGLSLLSMLSCGCIVALDATGHWHFGGK